MGQRTNIRKMVGEKQELAFPWKLNDNVTILFPCAEIMFQVIWQCTAITFLHRPVLHYQTPSQPARQRGYGAQRLHKDSKSLCKGRAGDPHGTTPLRSQSRQQG